MSASASSKPSASATGRVLQVNISPGGVPKLPVSQAYVDRLGLAGDRHHDVTDHGGPHRAVSLFAIEAIRRVQAEGHPISPGTAGENLTTEGLELAELPVGTRLAIGERLLLEISKPDNPCVTIAGNFRDGRFARISILTHPRDSRMYARVLETGAVRAGDPIRVLPPAPDSSARVHELLDRFDAAERGGALALWRGAAAAGHDVRVVDDGELAIAVAPSMRDPIFSSALGLRQLPHLLGRVLDVYRQHATVGWLAAADPPWPGATGTEPRTLFAAQPSEVARPPSVPGLSMRVLSPDEVERWVAIVLADWQVAPAVAAAFRDGSLAGGREHGTKFMAAELDGELVGAGRLVMRRHAGLIGGGAVLRHARGRGIHRALIAARARLAAEAGCDHVGVHASPGTTSARNVAAMGFSSIWTRRDWRFDPADPEGPRQTEAVPTGERMA